ncbi:MAG: hypothetical protein HYW86_03985 [Candidatus Roizmanbacteria bacterium]|nr:MAG: hypothetical protein HYW86_03985 [Candidatus Roizmanbacteria bacterium]
MGKNFYAIGHIVNDLGPPHLGGGVPYTGVAAQRLGFKTHIITKCPPNHPYIKELESYGIIVHRLPVRNPQFENKITSGTNIYDDQGNRQQIKSEIQEDITVEDLKNFPNISSGSVILVAVDVGEVDTKLFPIL